MLRTLIQKVRSAPQGYAGADVVEITFRKTRALNAESLRAMSAQAPQWRGILAVCYAAAVETHRPLRVLDFGGACGVHYLIARIAVPDLPLRWAVVETPMMAERAAALATDNLRFFSNAEAAASWLGGVDLLYSSGTLQYLPEPAATIRELCGLTASHICKLPLN